MKIHLKIIACFLTVLAYTADVEEALRGPPWMYDGIMYCIFPRNFSPAGDFKGVAAKLEDLKKLGVTILWFLPLHPIGEKNRKGTLGSPYSVKDYYAVNPAYGTKEDFKNLVAQAHQLGFKVIKDSAINHTAWDSILIQKKAFYK